MEKVNIKQSINSLPKTQQIALWVIIRLPGSNDQDFSFRTSGFAAQFKKYAADKVKFEEAKYGRFIGGLLSGLSRNKILARVSGDRDTAWTLTNEIKDNLDDYKKYLFEVKVYWDNG